MEKNANGHKNAIVAGVAIAVISLMIGLMSCNSGSDYTTTTNASADTVTKAMADTAMPADNTMVKKDTVLNDTINRSMAKPNPAKKGKKGKVSITLATAARSTSTMDMDKEGYYENVEVAPSYPGGQSALEKFFENNIEYPQEASENGIEGVVQIKFSVDENGKISQAKAVNAPIGYGIEEEALRVFNKMPVWTAARIKGKNIKTRYTLPVRFQLSD